MVVVDVTDDSRSRIDPVMFIILVTAVVVLICYFVPMLLVWCQANPGAQQTLVAYVEPRVIQNASIVYRTGLVALVPFLAWGIGGEIQPAVVYLASVGLGLLLLYGMRRPILQFLDRAIVHNRSITIHEFIACHHGNDRRVRALAGALTVFAIYGLIVCAMIALANVLEPILSSTTGAAQLFTAAIFLAVATCILFTGQLGTSYATQLQLALVYLGLFASTAFLIYLQASALGAMPASGIVALALIAIVCATIHFRRRARYLDTNFLHVGTTRGAALQRVLASLPVFIRLQKILSSFVGVIAVTLIVLATIVAALELFLEGAVTVANGDLNTLNTNTSFPEMTLISLILLPLLHPVVDVVNWQTFADFATIRGRSRLKEGDRAEDLRHFDITYMIEIPLIALFIFLFGIVAGLTRAGMPATDAMRGFILSSFDQENFVAAAVVTFLVLSLFALAAATIGSLFSASISVLRCDIIRPLQTRSTSATRCDGDEHQVRWTLTAGFAMELLVLVTFLLADAHSFGIAKLVGATFCFGSVQLALAPLVLAPLIAGAAGFGTVTPAWAFAILFAGAAIGVGMAVTGLVLNYESALSWAVPACLGTTTLLLVIGSLATKRAVLP
jgi:hypothetical protein